MSLLHLLTHSRSLPFLHWIVLRVSFCEEPLFLISIVNFCHPLSLSLTLTHSCLHFCYEKKETNTFTMERGKWWNSSLHATLLFNPLLFLYNHHHHCSSLRRFDIAEQKKYFKAKYKKKRCVIAAIRSAPKKKSISYKFKSDNVEVRIESKTTNVFINFWNYVV